MGELVFADRHGIGFVEQNVRGLQNGIPQKPMRGEVTSLELFLLFLIRRISFQPRDRGQHREE